MDDKALIFVPYQDTDNYLSDGILTREYAMLFLLYSEGYEKVINIKKPRTWLDKKRYKIKEEYYPKGTVEYKVKDILDRSETIQFYQPVSIEQVIKKRGWWKRGYDRTIKKIKLRNNTDYLVYSNNPFASDLLENLHSKGCEIYFDIMDNFAIHPSLNQSEKLMALEGYQQIFKYAEYVSANSQQTCNFMSRYTNKKIHLIKNGVFANNEIKSDFTIEEVEKIRNRKKGYRCCVGYIGKLGLRLDANLIDEISKSCNDVLFVFVGGYLKDQINVPSAYVYPILNEFDILAIPHATGKSENGGDPLKLYQYLTRNKPIISTPILGVDEFQDYIAIECEPDKWVDFINSNRVYNKADINGFTWNNRIKPIIEEIK